MLAGDKCVLMKERGVMVVGLSLQEWRVLLEKNTGSDKMQMISGVEEAVMAESDGEQEPDLEDVEFYGSEGDQLAPAIGGSSEQTASLN